MAPSLGIDIDRTLTCLLQLRMITTDADLESIDPDFHKRLQCIQTKLTDIESQVNLLGDHYPSLERFNLRIRYMGDGIIRANILESGKSIRLRSIQTWPLPAQETFVQLMGSIHFDMWPAATPVDLPKFTSCLRHLPKHVPELVKSHKRSGTSNPTSRLITMAISQAVIEADDFRQNLQRFFQALADSRPPRTTQDPAIRIQMEWNKDKLALPGTETMRIYGLPGFRISIQVTVNDGMKSYETLCDTITDLQRNLNRERSLDPIHILPDGVMGEIFRYLVPREATFARYRSADGMRPHANIDQLGLFHGAPEDGHKVNIAIFQVNQLWRKTAGEMLREHTRLILHDDLHNALWTRHIYQLRHSLGGDLFSSRQSILFQVRFIPRPGFTTMMDYFTYSKTSDTLSLTPKSRLTLMDIHALLHARVQPGHDEMILSKCTSSEEITATVETASLHLHFRYGLQYLLKAFFDDVTPLQVIVEIDFEVIDHWNRGSEVQAELGAAAERYKMVVLNYLKYAGRTVACGRDLMFSDESHTLSR